MIIKFVFLIVLFMAHYNFKPTNSNLIVKMLIQFNAKSHNDIENSKSSKSEARRLFNATGRTLISTFERNQINKGCIMCRSCTLRRASSTSIAGKFRELSTYFRCSLR